MWDMFEITYKKKCDDQPPSCSLFFIYSVLKYKSGKPLLKKYNLSYLNLNNMLSKYLLKK